MNREIVSPDDGLQRLLDGNRRFIASNAQHPNQTGVHRLRVAREPQPFAVVLGCADARVPPELVFDQGLGDLFVVRVAGNIVDEVVLGSIEYAVEQFGIRLVVVLGHEQCGAVAATIRGERVGHIGSLAAAIQPAVNAARGQLGDLLDNAIVANVQLAVSQLRTAEPLLAPMTRAGTLKIVGARYALHTGMVDLLTD